MPKLVSTPVPWRPPVVHDPRDRTSHESMVERFLRDTATATEVRGFLGKPKKQWTS